jgi:ERCC4-related helicase
MTMDSPETVQADLVAPKVRVDAVVKCVFHDEAHLAQLLDRRIAKVAD